MVYISALADTMSVNRIVSSCSFIEHIDNNDKWQFSPGSRNLLWGGRFTRGAAMYAKLFERRRGVQSAYDGGGGGGGGGAVGKLH